MTISYWKHRRPMVAQGPAGEEAPRQHCTNLKLEHRENEAAISETVLREVLVKRLNIE